MLRRRPVCSDHQDTAVTSGRIFLPPPGGKRQTGTDQYSPLRSGPGAWSRFRKQLTQGRAKMAVIIGWFLEWAMRLIHGGCLREMREAVKILADQARREAGAASWYVADRVVVKEEDAWTDKSEINAGLPQSNTGQAW